MSGEKYWDADCHDDDGQTLQAFEIIPSGETATSSLTGASSREDRHEVLQRHRPTQPGSRTFVPQLIAHWETLPCFWSFMSNKTTYIIHNLPHACVFMHTHKYMCKYIYFLLLLNIECRQVQLMKTQGVASSLNWLNPTCQQQRCQCEV